MTKRLIALTSVTCALVVGVVVYGQNNAADTAKLIEVLQLKPGSVVAEIGAGSGDLTIALANHVGPTGRVYTSELGEDRIKGLRAAVAKSGATNVEVIDGQAAHANLSEGCCDAIFMRNVYHHFGDPTSMNASFLKALKPGGRLAVIDFAPRRMGSGRDEAAPTTAPPGKRGEDSSHGVGADVVSAELKAAGFQIVSATDQPAAPGATRAGAQRWFMVVASKQ
jgi:ubiquinone/menaquinone biosynthesis C-methylase UbiE